MAYYPYNHGPSQRDIISARYGGIDEDVRKLFLQLNPRKLDSIFHRYELEFGKGKRQYAEKTYLKWKAGTVSMSGQISERLIHFLPPELSFDDKYELVSRLWHRFQPKSNVRIKVTPETGLAEVVAVVANIIQEKQNFSIPDVLKARVQWLANDDANAAELLLKEVIKCEAQLIQREAQVQVENLVRKISENDDLAIHGSKTLIIAGTTIHITVKRTPFYRRIFMSDQESNANTPAKRENDAILPLNRHTDLLGSSINHISDEQYRNLAYTGAKESLRLQTKLAESEVDVHIAKNFMDNLTNQVRKLPNDPRLQFRGETEHAGTRMTVQKGGCFIILVIVIGGAWALMG